MPDHPDDPPALLESNHAALNADFYKEKPWRYFQQRLAHLVLVASDSQRYRAVFAEPLSISNVSVQVDVAGSDEYPSAEQSFTAVEAEVLLHHVAETLLRLVHAHSEPDPCPWLRMSRLTSARVFKEWVEKQVTEASHEQLGSLSQYILAVDPQQPSEVDACARYLRLFGQHFLDADPYNAAKHGMALSGGSERREIEIDGQKLFQRDGAVVNWLSSWPRDDVTRPTRWTRGSRLYSTEAVIALINVAIQLMQSIWICARARHLDEAWEEVYRPSPPEQLFQALGLRHHVLGEWFTPLAYEGEPTEIIIKTAHLDVPRNADRTGDPGAPPASTSSPP